MAEVQKAALESYNKVKAERGEVTALDMFIAGRDWFKEQMMKDAIEGFIEVEMGRQENKPYDVYAVSDSLDTTKFKIGDKVKVIIIKE